MAEVQEKENVPVIVTELLQLTHLGVPLEDVTWQRVTMTSDKSICVRYREHFSSPICNNFGGHKSILTILSPPKSSYPVLSSETVASSARINPFKPVIAIKAGYIFRIYDLITYKLLHKYQFTNKVSFWTWVDLDTIVIVTESAIFHWFVTDGTLPVKMFCRHPRLTPESQIVNYVTDDNGIWMAVVGLSSDKDKVIGVAQLYSLSRDFSQPLEAHAICFATYCFHDNQHSSTIFIAATRSELTGVGKLYIIELGPHQDGNAALVNTSDSFNFKDTWDKYDFPVSIQSCAFGLIYILSKYGYLYLCDIETGFCMASIMICTDIIFTSSLNSDTQGIMVISRNGQVLAVDLEEYQICDYTRVILKRPALADRLFNTITRCLSSS